MIKLSKENLHILNQLELPKNDVTIPGYLQGIISGTAWVNDIINPTTAILVVADFCYLIGNIHKKYKTEIIDILKDNCKGKLICYANKIWSEFIEENFAETFKKRIRYSFKHEPNIFDRNKLEDYADAILPEFNTERINEELYHKALQQQWTEDFCSNFLSLEHFLNHGIGYVIMKDGEIISGASSYSYCEGNIDITIETKPEYQRKYPDIMMIPQDTSKGYQAVIIEFKYLKAGEKAMLEEKQKEAKEQIQKRQKPEHG